MIALPGTTILYHDQTFRALRDDLMPWAELIDLTTGEVIRQPVCAAKVAPARAEPRQERLL